MMKMSLGIVGLVLVGLCGCGSAPGEAAAAPPLAPAPDPEAVSKCHDFVVTLCTRVVVCDSSQTPEACVSSAASGLDCGQASGVSSSYDRCISEMGGFDCTVLDGGRTRPASCKGVIVLAP